jgi:CheY-like chemotaxis protein
VPNRTADPSLTILLVDDDVMVREATAWMLADAGHRVHEAADGVAALEYLNSRGPVDLVITDINMPRMDGLQLAQHTRARWPRLPVLLVSGRPQPPGTQEYMPKPFGWETLMQAVSRIVQTGGHTEL